jgi:hypothetical protein
MGLKTQYADDIMTMLQDARDVGLNHVVLMPSVFELKPVHFSFFQTKEDALSYLASKVPDYLSPDPVKEPLLWYRDTDTILHEIIKVNELEENQIMNRNNWENIQDEMKQLRFSPQAIEEVREKMEKGITDFTAHDQIKGTKGVVDVTAHFRQSGQSENYYMNKFTVALNTGKLLEEGQKYFVISPNEQQPGKNISRSFVNVSEAISFFKEQKGDSKLAAGKDAAHTRELATMKAGKIDYVEKDFARTFRTPAQTQTFFVERGRGFTVEQAANLIQGRSVFRDDLLNLGGQPYAAWVKLDFDSPKDKYQNYTTNQYHVPSYGFSTKEALEKFNIQELADATKAEKLMKSIENGNRPLITTVKDGQDVKLFMEASPRYRQVNFFQENGKPEKREQFLKEPQLDQKIALGKGQGKEQEQGMAV